MIQARQVAAGAELGACLLSLQSSALPLGLCSVTASQHQVPDSHCSRGLSLG